MKKFSVLGSAALFFAVSNLYAFNFVGCNEATFEGSKTSLTEVSFEMDIDNDSYKILRTVTDTREGMKDVNSRLIDSALYCQVDEVVNAGIYCASFALHLGASLSTSALTPDLVTFWVYEISDDGRQTTLERKEFPRSQCTFF